MPKISIHNKYIIYNICVIFVFMCNFLFILFNVILITILFLISCFFFACRYVSLYGSEAFHTDSLARALAFYFERLEKRHDLYVCQRRRNILYNF